MARKPPKPTLTSWYPSSINPVRAGYYELLAPFAARPPVLPVFAKWTGTGWTEFSGGDFEGQAVTSAQEWMGTDLAFWRGISTPRGVERLLSLAAMRS